ncbi:hypothetical protein TVAG_259910 [Trichomonas vaginalis G3]|uniref:Uncharacterized protein n=1 Tax=Trichomonas vaginalis (strain ATCC PRA-98 / G3) TaxID=412133 RepID=A2E8S4_TRIV3|nr:hypothetical protein TVAGG3_0926980 [Trichomonas vaginalis G3]EAY10906.1 hypothetical protein TVAG_259910 [Trichomonas vaginalis G3]KAI5485556.1 hypothetical protein TVAGG3_0926980 [Trichomonas vaginalis G3]|eukprot:XP_001323129.1 hypothetical protein [Trichomonas vaginalis G3]
MVVHTRTKTLQSFLSNFSSTFQRSFLLKKRRQTTTTKNDSLVLCLTSIRVQAIVTFKKFFLILLVNLLSHSTLTSTQAGQSSFASSQNHHVTNTSSIVHSVSSRTSSSTIQ